jgi:hypothetical protein
MLAWCHHIHHLSNGDHTVHHCGGDHSKAKYTIRHCKCGLHSIDREYIVSIEHAVNEIEVVLRFTSPCPEGGFHIESAIRY